LRTPSTWLSFGLRLAQPVEETDIHIFTDSLTALRYLQSKPNDKGKIQSQRLATNHNAVQYALAVTPLRSFAARIFKSSNTSAPV
jgi:hypothetical protein